MDKIKLKDKEKLSIKLGLSLMLNLFLVVLLTVSLTYGNAFGGKYSLGIPNVPEKGIVFLYSEKALLNYWIVSDGVIYGDRDDDFVNWQVENNTFWSNGTVVVMEVNDTSTIDYEEIKNKYNATDEQIENIKKKLKE